jgi:hypothetical protein
MFQIFSTIIETIKDPQFSKITFEWDLAKRTARIEVPGIVRATSEPIRNPVTNEEHRMLRAAASQGRSHLHASWSLAI